MVDQTRTDRAGGYLCGAVRYRISSDPFAVGYRHCRICQRTAGAPVMVFAPAPVDDLVTTKNAPRRRRSSAFGQRWLCGECGSPPAMRVDHQPQTFDIAVAALDDPSTTAPVFHI